jgi:hypothetical protein
MDVDQRAELAVAGKTCAVPYRGGFNGELDAVDLALVAVVVLAALMDDNVAGPELRSRLVPQSALQFALRIDLVRAIRSKPNVYNCLVVITITNL